MTNNDGKSKKTVWIVIVCAILVAIPATVTYLRNRTDAPSPKQSPLQVTEQAPEKVPPKAIVTRSIEKPSAPQSEAMPEKAFAPAEPATVVDYGKLKDDKKLQALMDKRKEEYGFKKGVDIIVKPDESIKVGTETIPMQKILDDMRLGSGEVIEKDITDTEEKTPRQVTQATVDQELKAVENRIKEIEKQLSISNSTPDKKPVQKPDQILAQKSDDVPVQKPKQKPDQKSDQKIDVKKEAQLKREYAELKKLESVYEKYQEKIKEIEEKKAQLERLPMPEAKTATEPAEASETPRQASKPPETLKEKAPAIQQETLRADKAVTGIKPDTPQPEKPRADKTVTDIKPNSSQLESPPSNRLSPDPPVKAKPFMEKDRIQMPGIREGSSQQKTADLDAMRESLREELNTLLLQKGDLEAELKMLLQQNRKPDAYGIYVVQRNDNIWNIHFKFLTEYFRNRGIEISRLADEPDHKGRSSGVGKILKFSENLVFIYNTRERRLASDINLLQPFGKIVVFNMGKVFELLDNLSLEDIDQLQFDGENLWLPARG